ncbi:GNAT family N-acetyltransferase [Salinarimonas sp. NSM]|uniref:GNAT family N-acetyltransferase n=1 Tax=Salinarimonas sp. NSM TaxID=3458003 RepID=UPI004034FB37
MSDPSEFPDIGETAARTRLDGRVVAEPPSGLVPPRTPLAGRSVVLEPLEPRRHAEELHASAHGSPEAERIWDYLAYGPWPERAPFEAWLRECAAAFDPIFYAIRPAVTGRAEGMASFLDIHPRTGVIEIGHIWLGPGLQRTRAATEALFLMMSLAMDDLRYRRLQWRCNALNARSRAAARRLGFRFEGVFHAHMIVKGRNRDTAWYSITAEEWPAVRETLAAWVEDSNFDAAGAPRRSLAAMMAARQGRG